MIGSQVFSGPGALRHRDASLGRKGGGRALAAKQPALAARRGSESVPSLADIPRVGSAVRQPQGSKCTCPAHPSPRPFRSRGNSSLECCTDLRWHCGIRDNWRVMNRLGEDPIGDSESWDHSDLYRDSIH